VEQQGYKILAVKKILYYPRYQLNLFHSIIGLLAKKKICGKGMFAESCPLYFNHKNNYFLGFPRDDMSFEEKTVFARKLSKDTGLQISPKDINTSPAMVMCAKLAVNSIIGKLQILICEL
jgi:hypothetical protein